MIQHVLSSRRPLQVLIVALYAVALVARRVRPSKKTFPQHVVHVSPAYFDEQSYVGGGERGAMSLAEVMSRDTDTCFVSFDTGRRRFKQGSLNVEIYPMRGTVDGTTASPISYAFLRELLRADVVHCHQFQTPTIQLTILAAVILRKRVFVTDHAAIVTSFTNRLPISRLVDGYLAESTFTLRVLPPFPAVRMIYGGVSERFLDADDRADAPRERTVLFVGRLVAHKGVNYLIEAVGDDIPLDVIGRPYDERYYALLQSLARGKKVRFITDASDEDIIAAYDRAAVTVLPSVYDDVLGNHHVAPELLGLTLVESMARGTPVICTDVGGMPEYVADGVTGFVVPPNSPTALRARIDYLLQNPAEARAIGRRARRRALEEFTWDAAAGRALAAYQDL